MKQASYKQIAQWLLRVIGVSTSLAFFAIFLPLDWMDAIHVWLGLGETPQQAIFSYLTRSLSAMYFAHGAMVLLVSTDVYRFLPLVKLIACLNILLGLLLILIDVWSAMPWFWIAAEGLPIACVGFALLSCALNIRQLSDS